jgi:plasmid stability protein
MAAATTLTIRNLDEQIKARLRVRAAQHGWSMEEEVRVILRTALAPDTISERSLYAAIRERLGEGGGVDISLPDRETMPEPPDFSA